MEDLLGVSLLCLLAHPPTTHGFSTVPTLPTCPTWPLEPSLDPPLQLGRLNILREGKGG